MLSEILDKTARRVGRDLNAEPEVQCDLRLQIAKIYEDIARYDEAEAIARENLETARSRLKDDADYLSGVLEQLGRLACRSGRFAESEEFLQEAIGRVKRLHGDESPELAWALNELACLRARQGRFPEAETLWREAVAFLRKRGVKEGDFAMMLQSLASCLGDQGKLAEAEAGLQEALSILRATLGNEHPDVAFTLRSLSISLFNRREYAEAEALGREALAINEKLLGDQHPETASAREHVAECLMEQGKYAEAEVHYRRFLATAQPLSNTVNRLCFALLAQEKPADVEALYSNYLPEMRAHLPAEHPILGQALAALAEALLREGKSAEAEKLSRECLALRAKTVPGTVQEYNARAQLGASLAGQGKYFEAEPLLLSGFAGLREELKDQLKGSCAPCKRIWGKILARNARILTTLYRETGRSDAAAAWEKVALEFETAAASQ
jgi:hypothetical protein